MLPFPNGSEISAILPEIILVVAMCVALIVPVLPPFRSACRKSHAPMFWIALVGLVAAALCAAGLMLGSFGLQPAKGQVFGGMFTVDHFALTFKVILFVFTVFVLFLFNTTTRDRIRTVDGPDYITLILGGALGMSMMASASNFLTIFLAIEAASFPSYALAGFYKTSKRGSEASLKYVLFGAVTSSIMLYGLSMLYGTYGSLDLVNISQGMAESGMTAGLWIGIVGFMIGLGFKLSAVPMHFWCPDVFEAAPFEVTTFLSVASKGAAVVLLLRVMMTFGFYSGSENVLAIQGISTFVGVIGLITATWGNLAAYYQTNIKRLLAFSSIAHAGYMIMAAGLATTTMSGSATNGNTLAYAILFYITVYCFMNFGAFSVAAIVDRETGSESLEDYAGLGVRNPLLAFMLGCFLLALFGMPGTGGFWGKVFLGFAMWDQGAWWFVAALVINTVFSLYIYLKPIIIMVWRPAESRTAVVTNPVRGLLIVIAMFGIFATGLLPDQATSWAKTNASIIYGPMASMSEARTNSDSTAASPEMAVANNREIDSAAAIVDGPRRMLEGSTP